MMKRLNLLQFVFILILLPSSSFTDTNLIINTIQAISSVYYFQYYLILSPHEKVQTVQHQNLLKILHSRIKLSTIVDIYIEDFNKYKKKVRGWKSSNTESKSLIVFNCDNAINQEKFIKFSRNVNFGGNELWLVFTDVNLSLEKFFMPLILPLNSQLIFALVEGSKYVYFKAPYRVAQNFPVRVTDLGNYSDTNGLNLPVTNLVLTRRDMEGVRLRTGTLDYPPLSTVIYKDGKFTSVGLLADIWKELSERLNFTYDYYLADDGNTGFMFPNGSWSGLVGMLVDKKIDVAVTQVSMTDQRIDFVDFGVPIVFNRKKIFYLDAGNQLEWGNLFRPFSVGVWLAIFLWFVVISIAHAYFFKKECSSNIIKHNTLLQRECTVLGCFFIAFRAITNQGCDVTPQSLSSRIVFYLTYLTMVVILPSYSAALMSYLTVQTPYKPFDSLRSMSEKRTHYLAVTFNSTDFSYFSDSTDPVLQDVFQKLIIPFYKKKGRQPKNAKEGISLVCHNNDVAYLVSDLPGRMYADVVFKKYGCKISSLETAVITAAESFAFQKGSPYARIFNLELKKIVHRGLLRHLQKDLYEKNPQRFNTSGYEEINLRHVVQIYSLFSGGFILAVIILAIEIFSSRRKKSKVSDEKLKNGRKVSKKRKKLKFLVRKVKSKKLMQKVKSELLIKKIK